MGIVYKTTIVPQRHSDDGIIFNVEQYLMKKEISSKTQRKLSTFEITVYENNLIIKI